MRADRPPLRTLIFPPEIGHRMLVTRVVAAIIAGLFLVAGSGVAAVAAPAPGPLRDPAMSLLAGVPPTALPGCQTGSEFGGWDHRNYTSTGSPAGDTITPYRPRALRLGEPCVTDGDPTTGELAVPSWIQDVPPVAIDEDDNGIDDSFEDPPTSGVPGHPGECIQHDIDASAAPSFAQVAGAAVECSKVAVTIQTGSGTVSIFPDSAAAMNVIIKSHTTNSVNFEIAYPFTIPTGSPSRGYSLRLYCGATVGGTPTESQVYSQVWSTSTPTLPTNQALTCTGGNVAIALVGIGTFFTTGGAAFDRHWGTIYRADGAEAPGDGAGYYGGTQGAQVDVSIESITCSVTYTGTATSLPVDGGVWQSLAEALPIGDVSLDWGYYFMAANSNGAGQAEDCKFLRTVTVTVTTYAGALDDTGTDHTAHWSSDAFNDHEGYDDPDQPTGVICDLYPDTPGCYEIINPPYVDGTDPSVACGSPPEPVWLDFSWLPDLIGYYAECLFVPLNGFDREHKVTTAWEGSALGETGQLATSVADTAQFTETCGTILDGSGTPIDGIEINTCEWSWADPFKTVITLGIVISFALWGLRFVVSNVVGVVNKRTPDPMDGE